MMKLYYSPNGGGSASFIAANCMGLSIPCEVINIQDTNPKASDGTQFSKLVKSCTLPCLLLKDASVLTEEATVLGYLRDQVKR